MKSILKWFKDFLFGKPTIQKVLPRMEVLHVPPPPKKTLADYEGSLKLLLEGYRSGIKDSDVLLKKAMLSVRTPEEWNLVYQAAEDTNIEDRWSVLDRIKEMQWTKEEWERLYSIRNLKGQLQSLVISKLLGHYNDTLSLLRLYKDFKANRAPDGEAEMEILLKLFSVTTRHDAEMILELTVDPILMVWAFSFLRP